MPKPNTNWPNPISKSLQNHLLGMGATRPGFDRCGGRLTGFHPRRREAAAARRCSGRRGCQSSRPPFPPWPPPSCRSPGDPTRGCCVVSRAGEGTARAATASGVGRWGERRLEGQGSERCVCFFSQYPSAWGFSMDGVVLLNGRFCPLQSSSPTRQLVFKSFCTVAASSSG